MPVASETPFVIKSNYKKNVIVKLLGHLAHVVWFFILVKLFDLAVYWYVDFEKFRQAQENLDWFLILLLAAGVLRYFTSIRWEVRIVDQTLEEGIKWPFRRELSKVKKITAENRKDLYMVQRADKVYDIIAERQDGYKVILYSINNKQPAKEKLYALTSHYLSRWNVESPVMEEAKPLESYT